MTLNTTSWDSAEYLKTADDIAAYLQASFCERDSIQPRITEPTGGSVP